MNEIVATKLFKRIIKNCSESNVLTFEGCYSRKNINFRNKMCVLLLSSCDLHKDFNSDV